MLINTEAIARKGLLAHHLLQDTLAVRFLTPASSEAMQKLNDALSTYSIRIGTVASLIQLFSDGESPKTQEGIEKLVTSLKQSKELGDALLGKIAEETAPKDAWMAATLTDLINQAHDFLEQSHEAVMTPRDEKQKAPAEEPADYPSLANQLVAAGTKLFEAAESVPGEDGIALRSYADSLFDRANVLRLFPGGAVANNKEALQTEIFRLEGRISAGNELQERALANPEVKEETREKLDAAFTDALCLLGEARERTSDLAASQDVRQARRPGVLPRL